MIHSVEISSLYRVSFCDESAGKVKGRSHSRSAILTVGMDDLERIFILESCIQHMSTDRLIEKIFSTNERWKPAIFGVDATGNQSIFADLIRRESRMQARPLPLRDVALGTEKTARIETTLQPLAAAGQLFRLPEAQCLDLKGEWQSFPSPTAYRDGLDALAGAVSLLPRRSPISVDTSLEMQRFARYLQSTGADYAYIKRKTGIDLTPKSQID